MRRRRTRASCGFLLERFELREQLLARFRMRGIGDDALDRADVHTLRRVVVADALGAKRRGYFVDLGAHRDRLVGTDGLADIAVDAETGDLEGHLATLAFSPV